ncbi:MAG: aspartate aminotransferase family protein [Gammaproteobacteria bacterium]|nr:MAG: aspartate aminotransferase family protein [Gammaproteobacteria bacterium]
MPLDVAQLLASAAGQNYRLHAEHVNPRFATVLRTIGFDRCYERAAGPYLWDIGGRRYLDMISGYGVFALGRNHPDIRQALAEFLRLEYASLVQMEAPLLSGLLAAELKKRAPEPLDTVYFTNSGTEGVETAIKFARCATGRPGLLYCDHAFHGLTNGSLALNGDPTFREGFEPFLPDCRQVPFNDLDALERALAAGDVAAFVVEPVQGKGVHLPAPGYLRAAAELCRRHGALFVADEVQTGIGRTGRFLAIEHEPGLCPDILVLSKALSGGYVPVGAVLTRRDIYDRVFSSLERSVVHSSTFGQGSLAMVAGLATLKALDEHAVIANAERIGARLLAGLQAMVERYEFLAAVRGRGMMIGIELGEPSSAILKGAWSLVHRMDKSLFPQAVIIPLLDDHGIITQVAGHHMDVVKLLPPLILDDAQADGFLAAFESVIAGLQKFPGPAWDLLTRLGKFAITSRPRRGAA